MNKFLEWLCVFSGFSETERGKNKNLFYFRGFRGAAFILFCGGGGRVHWVQVVQGAGASGVLRCVFRPFFGAFLLCLFGVACKYALISLFKGVFGVFWALRVGLCCLRALRGLCGFCVRE